MLIAPQGTMQVASDLVTDERIGKSRRRRRSFEHGVMFGLAIMLCGQMARAERSGTVAGPALQPAAASDRGDDTPAAARRRRQAWLLSLEAVTHAPVDMGVQLGVETPQGLRLFGGYGFVPGMYIDVLTSIAGNAAGNSYGAALLKAARYQGHTWRVQAGLRPFRAIGLYGDLGYARLDATGALDLSSTGVPVLERLGGGYQAQTSLDMWLIELGYQGEI